MQIDLLQRERGKRRRCATVSLEDIGNMKDLVAILAS
jgi:hypothetical protein